MEIIKKYVEANKNRFLMELFELLRIPSISADTKYKNDVLKTANLVKAQLEKIGIQNTELCKTLSICYSPI